jgi:hypothetical protein
MYQLIVAKQQHARNVTNTPSNMNWRHSTGCGKLTSFFEYEMPYKKGS